MRSTAPRRSLLAALAAALVALLASRASATDLAPSEPTFLTAPLQFKLTAKPPYAELVRSSGKTLLDVQVEVAHVGMKGGTALSPTSVEAEFARDALDSGGRRLTLTVKDPSAFAADGEYDVQLRFKWAGVEGETPAKPGAALREVTLVRPAKTPGQLPQERLVEQSCTLERSWPWKPTKAATYDLVIASTPIAMLAVDGEPLAAESGKRPEKLTGEPVVRNGSRPQLVKFTVPALREAGSYKSALVLSSPELKEPARIPVTVRVRDEWPAPLIAIAVGVALAWLVGWLSGGWRERELYRLARATAAADLVLWQSRVTSAPKKAAIAALDAQLERTALRAAAGEYAAARQEVEKVAAEVAAFAAREAEKRAELWKALEPVRSHVVFWASKLPHGSPPLEELVKALGIADDLLAKFRYDEAKEQFDLQVKKLDDALTVTVPLPAASPQPLRPLVVGIRWVPPAGRFPLRKRIREGTSATFEVVDDKSGTTPQDVYLWRAIGLGAVAPTREAGSRRTELFFPAPGDWNVEVEVHRGGTPIASARVMIRVYPDDAGNELGRHARRLEWSSAVVSLVAVVLASLTGLLALWVNKSFGTVGDYLLAVLWGFGINNTVTGLSGVLAKMRPTPGT